ncbi:MAG: class I SAM-dependent methyltransferase [Candidatus Binatales bacterium]
MTHDRIMPMSPPPQLTPGLLADFPKNSPTDPIEYYRTPLIGHFFRERINLGLRLLGERRYSKALEVGYGSGAVLSAIAPSVDDLHGVDLDADAAAAEALLRARGCVAKLIRGSVYELPYEAAEFELVVCFSVFEHLHEYEQGLREVVRVLKPEGSFLLGMPAVNLMMEAGFRMIGFKGIGDHHVTTPQAVACAFERVGLRVAREARLRLVPGVSLYFNWLLQKAGG